MAAVGSISEFDVSNPSSWDLYCEQLTYFLEANNITTAERKRATLIAVCGIKTVGIIRSLITPSTIAQKTFDEITAALKTHFSPRPSIIFSRFKFHKRIQSPNEGISDYVAELRRLAEVCDFDATLSERLRDQLVCGLRDEGVQRRLLSETSLTLEDAVSKALAHESAASQVKSMHSLNSGRVACAEFVDYVKSGKGKSERKQRSEYSKGAKFSTKNVCFGCGEQHERVNCRFRDANCRACGNKGHIERVCRKKCNEPKNPNFRKLHGIEVVSSLKNDYCLNSLKCSSLKDNVVVKLEGHEINMEVDSGSYYSIISFNTFKQIFGSKRPKLSGTSVKLRDFQKNNINLAGRCTVEVQFKNFNPELELLVANFNCTNILGYSWFDPLGISISGINSISDPVLEVVNEFHEVFSEGLGAYTGPEVKLPIDSRVPPIRCKARNVPLAFRAKIEIALKELLEEGVIEPYDNPKWATPVVPVLKPSGQVRLCGDYKTTLNKAMAAFPYPIPAINNLLTNLKGGGFYAKIDLAQAYLQLRVDKESAEAQTIITHKGAFKVNRLQFGVNVAPGLFQSLMEELFAGLEGVIPYFDDVLVRAETREELACRLTEVLSRLKKAGLRAKKEKCLFGVKEVDFLGYRVNKEGIYPSKSKVEAIRAVPIPTDKQRLRAFLGLINFYHGFLENKATIAEPLHRLLDNNAEFKWTKMHTDAFNDLKELISSSKVLVPFDASLPIILTCDASPYGVGAVLSHKMQDGREAPVAFSSRTLTSTERNYAQIDKEALAIVSAIKKFHHFLYGHTFTVITDHQPLLGLFSRTKATPEIISPRMLRWSLMLNAYDFSLIHRPGKKIGNADALSRIPEPVPDSEVPPPYEVLFMEDLECPPLSAREIARFTCRDPILSRVLSFVLRGWPERELGSEFNTYFRKRSELSAHKNCLLWGNRVVIPERGRQLVLRELHLAHPGVERMKALARCYVWWPHIDTEIQGHVAGCLSCQETRHAPPRAPVHPWEITTVPWSRLHVDFAGPFQGHKFLVVVDSFSKYTEVKEMSSTTASSTIDVLRDIFATHGIPDVVVSDNGPPFQSKEYGDFLDGNAVRRVLIAPRRPAGNGQAERVVQSTKDSLRRIVKGTWKKRLAQFLLHQHITPSTVTGHSPGELLMGRRLRSCLDRLHPDFLKDQREKQELAFEKTSDRPLRQFEVDDSVMIRNYSQGPEWIPAVVTQSTGPVSYRAATVSGEIVRRHVDQMMRAPPSTSPTLHLPSQASEPVMPTVDQEEPLELSNGQPSTSTVPQSPCVPSEKVVCQQAPDLPQSRPRRTIRKPERYRDFVTH